MNILRNVVPAKWSSGLCACHGWGVCCMTMFFPCVTFGRNAHMIDEGKSSCVAHGFAYAMLQPVCCQCVLTCFYREKLRAKYGLPKEPCNDICVHFFCGPCALCQEHAELKSRGLDPSKGWKKSRNSAPMPLTMYK
ncbi:hypothetical protein ACHQM5_014161 [Ranunculus cassubicifolius]